MISACTSNSSGGGEGPAPVKPMSAEEQSTFDKTAEAVSESTQWQAAQQNPRHARVTNIPSQKKAALEALVAKNCVVNVTQPAQNQPMPNPGQPGTQDLSSGLTLGGPYCPITFEFANANKIMWGTDSMSFKGQFALKYEAMSADAKDALDVQEYALAMSHNMDANQNGGSAQGSGTGRIVTKSQGTIKVDLSMSGGGNQDASSMTTVMKLTYPKGLVVELKQVDSYKGDKATSTYYINNVPVTKERFTSYMKKFGMDNREEGQPQQKSPEQEPAKPTPGPVQPNPQQPGQPGGGQGQYTKSYQLKENGCDTGMHQFTSDREDVVLSLYCSALQNNALNNQCAINLRRMAFENECPGVFSPR